MPNGTQLPAGSTVRIQSSSPYFPAFHAKVGSSATRIYTRGEFCKVWSDAAQGYSDGMVIFYFYPGGEMEVWAMEPPPGHTIYSGTWSVVV